MDLPSDLDDKLDAVRIGICKVAGVHAVASVGHVQLDYAMCNMLRTV